MDARVGLDFQNRVNGQNAYVIHVEVGFPFDIQIVYDSISGSRRAASRYLGLEDVSRRRVGDCSLWR